VTGYTFNEILGDIEVHEVREGSVCCESSSNRDPHIWMLGFKYRHDGSPGLLIYIIGIENLPPFSLSMRYLTAPLIFPCRTF
jgi:hypothetical protein